MKKIILTSLASLLVCLSYGQNIDKRAFDLLDLNRVELKEVKKYHSENNDYEAAKALLEYYKKRTSINHPDVNLSKVKLSAQDKKHADEALEHKFFVHKGYQPSYFYGNDINWEYWPVKDNELRWQLHRHKWWSSLGKAFQVTKDEKYAKEWAFEYVDWIKKNQLIDKNKQNLSKEDKKAIKNMRFAWRPLEVSHRLQDQTGQFLYFLSSIHFTPEFLTQFLVNYHKHAEHILNNYSKSGNHLLFEAQRVIYAGALFPEFKDAEKWRKSGISVLNREIKKQVYDDGMQYELDPHYHMAAINIFYKALKVADMNGFRNEFPDYYLQTIENMINITYNITFPNYYVPCFGDARMISKKNMIKNYKRWQPVFPNNKPLLYFATDSKKGELPTYKSKAHKTSGYYVLRNGWKENATSMVVKAGPPAFWHNQPDNGTFALYVKGRNFFPDAGSYVYGGDAEVLKQRNWFRQTMVHKTLTLDNKNIENTNSKLLLWDIDDTNCQKLVVENQSYENLKHRRTVFFDDETFFVIVDEALGDALGKVGIHYQFAEGKPTVNAKHLMVKTNYPDNNNIVVKVFGRDKLTKLEKEEGWVSYSYRKKVKRPAFVFQTNKKDNKTTKFITILYPCSDNQPKIKASFSSKKYNDNKVGVKVKINGKKYKLNATW